jgi:uncharacterized protein (TIGR02147 family)
MRLFDYKDYKNYLTDFFDATGRSGKRSAFSKAIGCQPAYLSRVLNGEAHLSPEQVDKASEFLGHTREEEKFFFFLVLWNRAGTPSLRKKIGDEIKELRDQHLLLKNRVSLRQPLPPDSQVTYYSAWYYTAVHMLFDIDEAWTPDLIASTLGLSLKRVSEVLSFLSENGLIQRTTSGYKILERETHIDSQSPLVAKHHINWRVKAIQSLEHGREESLHYSSVISVANKDIPKIREIMVDAIERIRRTVKISQPEETLYSYCLDLFPLSER